MWSALTKDNQVTAYEEEHEAVTDVSSSGAGPYRRAATILGDLGQDEDDRGQEQGDQRVWGREDLRHC